MGSCCKINVLSILQNEYKIITGQIIHKGAEYKSMEKFLMALTIMVLLTVNAMTGYFLYQTVNENNALKASIASPASNERVVVAEHTSTVSATTVDTKTTPAATVDTKVEPPPSPPSPSPDQGKATKPMPKPGSANSYLYYIDDQKIRETIPKGKQCVLKCNDEFKLPELPELSSEKDDMTVFYPIDATINTPYSQVLALAGFRYYKNDSAVTFDNAKEIVDFNQLKFSVQFKGRVAANLFSVYLEQDHRIESISAENSIVYKDSSLKSIKFSVKDIDFAKKAVLVVQHKEDESTYVFDVDFKKYVR
jgi:hypothetical protein